MFELSTIFFTIGYLFIVLGLVAAVVPVLPGPVLIWLGVFIWAWGDDFVRIGWPVLLILAVLTVISWGADLILSTISSRRSGAGWHSIGMSILGGLAGALVLSAIPIVGTFIGAILGALTALWYMEYQRQGDREAAARAVKGYISGFLLAMVVEFVISVLMLSIFVWQAFW